MGILIDKNTKVLIQGITGAEGSKACKEMLSYGTNVLCGVTPGKGGQVVEGLSVFNTIKEALGKYDDINTSVIYVPPLLAKDACLEAISNGIKLVICISENIPIHDTIEIIEKAKQNNVKFLGPSSLGIITPDESKIGSIGGMENKSYVKGDIGLVSKSGGMCSETALLLKNSGFGVSTALSIGGDTISGLDFCDILELFEKDDQTKTVVLYGEIGGEYENKVADMLKEKKFTKPLIVFIAGKFAESLPGITLGHAGALIEGERTTQKFKVQNLKDAGAKIADVHHDIIEHLK